MKRQHAVGLLFAGVLLFLGYRSVTGPGADRALGPPPAEHERGAESRMAEVGSPAPRASARPVEADAAGPAAAGADLPPDLQAACSLFGRLIDADGRPIDFNAGRSSIYATDVHGQRQRGEIGKGTYCFADLTPGTYWIRVTSFSGVHESMEREVDVLPADSGTRHDLLFPRERRLDVNVYTKAGHEISSLGITGGLAAVVKNGEGELVRFRPRMVNHVANPWGRVRLEPPMRLEIAVLFGDYELMVREVEPEADSIDLAIDLEELDALAGTVRCQVFDGSSENPVAGVTVWSEARGLPTDAAGVYEARLPPGRHTLRLEHEDYATRWMDLTLEPGALEDLGRVSMEPETRASGHVTGAEGVSELEVGARALDPATRSTQTWWQSSRTGARDGTFRLHLTAGEYLVEARARSGGQPLRSAPTYVDVRELDVSGLELELAVPVVVTLRLADTSADSLDEPYAILDADGWTLETGRFTSTSPQRHRLLPGTYTVRVGSTSRPRQPIRIDVIDDPIEVVIE